MTDLTQLESLARDVIAGVQHLRRTGREQPAAAHEWAENAAEYLRRALLAVEELQAEIDPAETRCSYCHEFGHDLAACTEVPDDLAPGTVVNILPRADGTNYQHADDWTVVGPSRHAYAVVVREPDYGTTVEVERSRVEVVS